MPSLEQFQLMPPHSDKFINELNEKASKILSITSVRPSMHVNVTFGKHVVSALIDTGAQSCTISYDYAKFFDLEKAIDKRHTGIVKGVGESNIVGLIPYINIVIDGKKYPTSVVVVDTPPTPNGLTLIIGANFLKYYKGVINMFEDSLHLEGIKIKTYMKNGAN